MKTNINKNDEMFRNGKTLELAFRKDELRTMISWLPEWNQPEDGDMRDLLVSQIHKTQMRIKTLEVEIKVINFVNGFRKPKSEKAN